jgi:hypothetical protein
LPHPTMAAFSRGGDEFVIYLSFFGHAESR